MEMKLMGIRFRVEIVIACLIIGALIGGQVLCSCIHTETAKKVVKEGMESMGSAIGYDMGKGVTGSWGASKKVDSISQQLDTHSGPTLPLAPGQLFFYADTEFKPECCVPPYSGTSSANGCACITKKQVDYINMRGGNNTGPSGV
tara:strand:- start:682 stop:1116 length:435 start_codon:yes stop_codon:yes gene_type:complete